MPQWASTFLPPSHCSHQSTMSGPSEQTNPAAILMYFGGIVLTAAAAVLGVFLNWVVALQGLSTGLFGINPWAGAFGGLAVACLGVWLWRAGGRPLSSRHRRIGRWTATAAFVVGVLGANHVLTATWHLTCSQDRPLVCYKLGQLLDDDHRFFEPRTAVETACRGGHIEACQTLLEADDAPDDWVREAADELCEMGHRCDDGDSTDECVEFRRKVENRSLPWPDDTLCELPSSPSGYSPVSTPVTAERL